MLANKSRLDIWLIRQPFLVILFLLALVVVLLSSFVDPIGLYDEGFTLTNAMRLLAGETPHQDYWSAYPAGTAGILAFFFKAFGASLLTARCVNAIWTAIFLCSAYGMAVFWQGRFMGAAWTAVLASWLAFGLYPSYSVVPAMALTFGAFALLVLAMHRLHVGAAYCAALVAGLLVLFRHDFAFYFIVAAVLGMSAVCWRQTDTQADRVRRRIAVVFVGGAGIVAIGMILILIKLCGFYNVLDQMFIFPATGMRANRMLPVPEIFEFSSERRNWILAQFVPCLLILGLPFAWLLKAWSQPLRRGGLAFSMVFCLVLILQARNRLDLPHVTPSVLFLVLFFCMLFPRHTKGEYSLILPAAKVLFLCSTVLVSGYLLIPAVVRHLQNAQAVLKHGFHLPARSDQTEVATFVRNFSSPSEPIFVGNRRHDEIFANDASLYFLLQRPVPVRWNEMHPGVVTTLAVQQAMVESLIARRVRVVVLVDMPLSSEPNASSKSSGIYMLDDFIKSKYESIYTKGMYQVFQLKGSHS